MTKGKNWFDMRAPELTEERKNDLTVLQYRNALDPKRFYKAPDLKTIPKYFQVRHFLFSEACLNLNICCLLSNSEMYTVKLKMPASFIVLYFVVCLALLKKAPVDSGMRIYCYDVNLCLCL